jgi:glycosyltransferase involved in cell wall biosynthesis
MKGLKMLFNIGVDGNEANVEKRVGSNVYAHKLLNYLAKLKQEKAAFSVFLKQKPLKSMPKKDKSWHYYVLRPKFFWTRWRLPLTLFLNKKLSLKNNKLNLFFTPGHYSPRFCPFPLVITIMDLAFLRHPNQFRKKDLLQLKTWTKESVLKASHVFTISKFSKKEIIHFYKIPKRKITVLYPGKEKNIENKYLRSKKDWQKLEKKYKLSKYLLCLGTLQPRKNLNRLFQGFAKLVKEKDFKDLKLVVVGKKGWLFDDILEGKNGLKKNLIFTGFVPEKEKFWLLKKAQSFVLPSLYEGFGIPVLEAMQVGCPVAVSKTSSLPEVAGKAGLYIKDPYSPESIYKALKKMLKLTNKKRKKLIQEGFKQADKFSWEKSAKKAFKVLARQAKKEFK